MRKARGGDVGAYEELVERHQRLAQRVASVICGPDDAADVAQQAFVKAWRALGGFREDSPFRPWFLRIVANEARNARRGTSRRGRLALRASDDGLVASAAPSVEEAVIGAERRRRLLEAIESLSDNDRDVIVCRFLAGLSEAETAAALGCRPGTVKSRSSRALTRLRTRLSAHEEVFRG